MKLVSNRRKPHAPSRNRGLVEILVLVFLIITALLLFLPYDHPTDTFPAMRWPAHYPGTGSETDPLQVAVDNAKRHAAEIHGRRFLGMLGAGEMGLAIKVVAPDQMPKINKVPVIAHATRGWAGMCVVHLSPAAVERVEVVAHEICHCVGDQDVLAEHGFVYGTTVEEIRKREAAAAVCEEKLIKEIELP